MFLVSFEEGVEVGIVIFFCCFDFGYFMQGYGFVLDYFLVLIDEGEVIELFYCWVGDGWYV